MKAIIPAAGLGTRFLPATKSQPKEMLPVADKPAIHYVVEEAAAAGIEDVLIVTGRGKRSIEDYFDRSFELEQALERQGETEQLERIRKISELARIYYVRQGEPKGLGDAVRCAQQFVGDEPFAVLLGDVIVQADVSCIGQLIDVYYEHRCPVLGIEKIDPDNVQKYGVIDGELREDGAYSVKSLIEKPVPEEAPSNLAAIGRYVLTPEVFESIERTEPGVGGEVQLTDALRMLLAKIPILAHLVSGKRYDIGSFAGWLEANVAFAIRDEELKPEVQKSLKKLVEN